MNAITQSGTQGGQPSKFREDRHEQPCAAQFQNEKTFTGAEMSRFRAERKLGGNMLFDIPTVARPFFAATAITAFFGTASLLFRSNQFDASHHRSRVACVLAIIFVFVGLSSPLDAAQIGIATTAGFLADSTGVLNVYDNTSANFFSTLNANNLGTFGWSFTNTGSTPLTDVSFFGFLDADIDRAINTALNEYGNVVSQTLPPGAPVDAITWNSFQIDEPGFTTGTILNNLSNGFLDNTNHVPPGTTNDVSLAIGFFIGNLNPGQSLTSTFEISSQNIGGLSQTDPDSNYTFYFNGYSTNPASTPVSNTPEPGTMLLLALAFVLLFWRVIRRNGAVSLAALAIFIPAQAFFQLATPANAQAPVVPNSWGLGKAMPTSREAPFTGVIGGKIYVIGGITSTAALNINEVYNPSTDSWTTGAPMPTPRWNGASAVINNVLYAIGGGGQTFVDVLHVVEAYDPATNTWSTKSPMPIAVDSVYGVVENNLIYVVGGYQYDGGSERVPTVQVYNPATDTWSQAASLNLGKSQSALGLIGSTIVSAGGLIPFAVTTDNEGYDATANSWRQLAPATIAWQAGCFGQTAGSLYLAGGQSAAFQPTSIVESYSLQTNSWTSGLTPMQYPVVNPGSALIGNHLYCFGGSDNGNPFVGSVFNYLQIYQFPSTTPAPTPVISNLTARFKDASVDLVWAPPVLPTGTTVAAYNLYRRTDTVPFALIQSRVSGVNFTDTGLTDGTTYYYVVRWVNASGGESPNSTEMSATPTSLANQILHKVPPTILSNPTVLATAGSAYSYAVTATSPNPGDTLTYSLPTLPMGMTIDSARGTISWMPTAAQSGLASAKVLVTGTKGYFASQMYQITVQSGPPTVPPMITSTPLSNGTVGQSYAYQIVASDPNAGEILTYSLVTAPTGMVIGAGSGLVQWVPATSQLGTNSVTVKTQDQFGLSATQTFVITVAQPTVLSPVITSAAITNAVATQLYSYQVTASDPNAGQTLAYALSLAPSGMLINESTGLIQWTPTIAQEGPQPVVITVKDALGGSVSQQFTVQVFAAQLLPSIIINSPVPNAIITQLTNMTGSIIDPNGGTGASLAWTVGILKPGAAAYVIIASGNGPVENSTIAQIDPTLLSNNVYPIRITATKGPLTSTADLSYSVAGNLKLGQFTVQFTDLSIPVAGIPITISRRYDSLDTSTGDFGAGWRLALPGQVTDSAGGQAYTVLTRIYVTRPDGKRVGFTFSPTYTGSFILPTWSAGFTPDPGVTDTLSVPSDQLLYSGGGFYTFSGAYDPTLFTLTTKEGVQYLIDENAGLQEITDTNGNTLTVTPGGFVSSTGVTLAFQRDAKNRIIKITEPGASPGTLQYAYDPTIGNLTSFTDQLGNVTNYSYENTTFPNYLTKIVDPLGRPLIRNVYDVSGRVVAQCDANSNIITLAGCVTFNPNAVANLQTVINARGYRTDLVLDPNGNVLTERHWLDSVNYLDTVRTYDSNNNVLTQIDPAGNKTTNTYDAASNKLTQTDPLNHTTSYTYNACNKVLTLTDPAGNVTTNTYDSSCNLLTVTDALKNVTTYRYNAQGQQSDFFDAIGNHWAWAYDDSGFVKTVTDPFGNATITTFGPTGDLLTRIDRNLRRIDFRYDAAHHLTTETWNSSPARITYYTYNLAGQLTSAADPDSALAINYTNTGQLSAVDNAGTPNVPRVLMSYSYDGDGNVTAVQDSLGGVTNYLYDPLDRLSQANQSGTGVNPKRVDYQYDAASFLKQLNRFSDLEGTQAVANTIFETDCNGCPGRITAIRHRRASDNSVIDDLTFVRDQIGNISSSTDAEGSHSYKYDFIRQLMTANHSNPTVQPNEFYKYDAAGNRLASHISNAYVYSYMSSAGNRVLQDQSSNYRYDNEGNLTSKADRATGAVLSYTYDYRNRLTSIIQATSSGAQSGGAQFFYDAINRRISETDSSGPAYFSYDAFNPILKLTSLGAIVSRRLYSRSVDGILADEASGQLRWFLTDQVGSVRDLTAGDSQVLVHYIYDTFGRLLSMTNANAVNDLLFTGREFNYSLGSGYFRGRSYYPQLGRFGGEDILLPLGYTYASNNPSVFVDPLGRDDLLEYNASLELATHTVDCDISLIESVDEYIRQHVSPPPFEVFGTITNQGSTVISLAFGANNPFGLVVDLLFDHDDKYDTSLVNSCLGPPTGFPTH